MLVIKKKGNTDNMWNNIKILLSNPASIVIIIWYSICIILSIGAILLECEEYIKYKLILKWDKEKYSSYSIKELNKNKTTSLLKTVSIFIVAILLVIAMIHSLNISYNIALNKHTDIKGMEQLINDEYEVYLSYGDDRKQSKLDNYEYKVEDKERFNITTDETNKKIILSVK